MSLEARPIRDVVQQKGHAQAWLSDVEAARFIEERNEFGKGMLFLTVLCFETHEK